MLIAERIAAMTSDLPQPIGVGGLSRFMAGPDGRRRSSFTVTAGGQALAEVAIIPVSGSSTQEQIDSFAGALQALLAGSEGRVSDAEDRAESLRQVVARQRAEIETLQARLADFEAGRFVRGEAYAIEGNGGVWLAGKPSASAFGLWFKSWADLARERPGLRPCGTVGSIDKPVNTETYVVMRPIADL